MVYYTRRCRKLQGVCPHSRKKAQHGDICWYDGVTDQHYENGKYYKLTPQPPEIIVIDLTDCPDEPEKED